jgi:Cu-processing system ATP-binding protein
MIQLKSVSFCYRSRQWVLDDVSFAISAGLTLLLGPNGCGKSTLLKLAAGVERPDAGTVEIDGHDLWRDEVAARRTLAYVSEQPDLTPYATIVDVLDLVCRLRAQPLEAGREALVKAGLADVARRSVRELSMGQRRRAVLAAAWIGSPRTILLDEPLEAMDRGMRQEILHWIDGLRRGGATILIATHDIEPFASSAECAVTVTDRRSRVFDLSPHPAGSRLDFLEALSRGMGSRERMLQEDK